jgi:hypothetical protein
LMAAAAAAVIAGTALTAGIRIRFPGAVHLGRASDTAGSAGAEGRGAGIMLRAGLCDQLILGWLGGPLGGSLSSLEGIGAAPEEEQQGRGAAHNAVPCSAAL